MDIKHEAVIGEWLSELGFKLPQVSSEVVLLNIAGRCDIYCFALNADMLILLAEWPMQYAVESTALQLLQGNRPPYYPGKPFFSQRGDHWQCWITVSLADSESPTLLMGFTALLQAVEALISD